MNDEIEIPAEDLRIDHWWNGTGKGSYLKIIHLPTGISVYEELSYDAKESVYAVKNRLMAELKAKIRTPKTMEA